VIEAMIEANELQQFDRALFALETERSVSNIGIWTFSAAVNVGKR
jgi:hypothetical protein